jgi:hypothetical protein
MIEAFFFLPVTELEFWILLGISQITRKIYPNSKQIFLRMDHPRLRNHFVEISEFYFDKIIELPFFSFRKNPIRAYIDVRAFRRLLKEIDWYRNSIIWGCGWNELIHWVISSFIFQRDMGCQRIISVHPMVDVLNENSELDVKSSIVRSLFSLPLLGGLTQCYREPHTKTFIAATSPKRFDIRVNIENSSSSQDYQIFNELPFPNITIPPGVSSVSNSILAEEEGFLVFLDATWALYGVCSEEEYWEGANNVIEAVSQLADGVKIFIKLHPENSDEYLKRIRNPNIVIINKTISAEELYLFNRNSIRGVFSSFSTSLLTASWFGIPAIDCSQVLGLNREYLDSMDVYYSNARRIKKIKKIGDFRKLNLSNDLVKKNLDFPQWVSLFKELGGVV